MNINEYIFCKVKMLYVILKLCISYCLFVLFFAFLSGFKRSVLKTRNYYLLLGGNLGDRSYYFSSAISLIRERIGVINSVSSLYETEPWGFEHKNWFLNQALKITSSLLPAEVLEEIHGIEKKLGRKRNRTGYRSRNIDIDILFVDEEIYYSSKLVIPHPRLHKRRFALLPLLEIAPTLRHPLLDRSVEEMAEYCKDTMRVSLYKSATTKSGNHE